ncbi:hypothetical protein IWQ57_006365, partial [Coemansia nantahalensis]
MPMSMPAAAESTTPALPFFSRKHLANASPSPDAGLYDAQQPRIRDLHQHLPPPALGFMPPPANPPSPQAASSTSASSTPLTMAAPHPRPRYQPASPQPYRRYDPPPRALHYPPSHAAGVVRHSPPVYIRQGQFSPVLLPADPSDILHAHLHERHPHGPTDAQPQLMQPPPVHPLRPPLHQAPPAHHPGAMPHPSYGHHRPPAPAIPQQQQQQQRRSPFMHKADRPAGAALLGRMAVPAHHRPYDMQPPVPTSRTFWNHYETGLLVDLWLDFEPQFLANKRNAGVWAQLARQLTEQSGRHRTVRECRIKWKNMWAKHR